MYRRMKKNKKLFASPSFTPHRPKENRFVKRKRQVGRCKLMDRISTTERGGQRSHTGRVEIFFLQKVVCARDDTRP